MHILRDTAFGTRLLRRSPGFAVAALLSLVLGIGINTAVYTLWDAIFLRPLPVEDFERLYMVYSARRAENGEYQGLYSWAYRDYQDLRDRLRTLDSISLHQWAPMNFSGGSEPQRGTGVFATANYFQVLGLEPALGRFYNAEEDSEKGTQPVVVLSHSAWGRLFGRDRGVLGQVVRVNGHEMTVIGVGPEGFRGTDLNASADFWLPMIMYKVVGPYADWFEARGTSFFRAIGRLPPGVDRQQAEEDLMRIARELEAEHPKEGEGLGARLRPLRESLFLPSNQERYRGYAGTLRTAAALILLICCINVSHLLLVRGLERRRELAVRQAMGAGQIRMMGQLLIENLTLFFLGGLLALPVARLVLSLLWQFRPPQIPADTLDLSPDPQVFAVALLATFVLGLLFGSFPAWRAVRLDLAPQLKEAPPTSDGGRRRLSPQRVLVMAQVALALVALVGAGLFFRSLRESYRIDLGFEVDSLAVMSIAPGEEGYSEEQTRNLYGRLLDEVRSLPGIEAATLSENRLLRGAVWQRQIYLEGETEILTIGSRVAHRTNVVVPGFFESVGIPLVKGRDFTTADRTDTPAVAVINQTLAETAWPGEDPIGRRFRFDYADGPLLEVVGVARDARYRHVREARQFFVYQPLTQEFRGAACLHVRTAGDPASVIAPVREKLRELAPELPVAQVGPLTSFVHEDLWLDRVAVRFLGLFGGLALLLAMVGVYGILAQRMNQRKREIGIRLSLGAQRSDLERQLMRETFSLVVGGLVLGLGLTFLVLRFATSLTDQLHGVSLLDPFTWVIAVVVLFLAGLVGGWVPGRRAVRVNPVVVLREE